MNQEMSGWTMRNAEGRESAQDGQDVIYLTGASGSLGSALLEVLVRLPSVKKMYYAVRGRDPQEKFIQSLKSRGYSADVWGSAKIHAVNYDMEDAGLGLDPQTYEKVESEVTVVMHNAWKLGFNQPVQQFDEDCLRSTMNLMSFCIKGPKKTFAFMSSVAAAMGTKGTGGIPELPLGPDPESALQTGYAQSKFIIEQITQNYASTFNVPVQILRVGQLSGHSQLGACNHTEMWPIMMMTALDLLSAMPVLQTTVDWLPVDMCAEAITDAVLSSTVQGTYAVTNLTNPSTTSWAEFISCLEEASGRRLERIEMKDWVSRLEAVADSPSSNGHDIPALKLLGFFQAMAGEDGNGEGVRFESPKVERGKRIEADMVRKWLATWK
ncbi:L-aminoadipate-semialdehyde dehydrogenase [Colletotrichum salicis]|uniref:L-aminoadipate-semialdehyde dehydrogenase n=1 Tax=Colletotrichum salicis TaxID=1209931 RepID=A0A135UJE1_9PEZI|nr:L-aminoadipate-semialdehyde dehydrogenase [Colletotrichum salicis]